MRQAKRKNHLVHSKVKGLMRDLGVNLTSFSQLTDIDIGLLSNIIKGRRFPSHAVMGKLIDVSNGSLTFYDWDVSYED